MGTMMYTSESNFTLSPGESIQVGGYELLYEDLFQEVVGDHLTTWVTLPVYQDGQYLTTLSPKIIYYSTYQQTLAEPAIRSSLREDLYLVFFKWESTGEVSLAVTINPLSSLLWLGGGILLAGGVMAWWPGHEDSDQKDGRKQKIWNRVGIVLLVLVSLLFVFTLWKTPVGTHKTLGRPLPGQEAPMFSAMDTEGTVFALQDHEGEVVVVHFWATWCSQCEEEMTAFESVWRSFEDRDVQFVGVAMDDNLKDVRELADSLNISFPLIVEENDSVTSLFGITAVPETFIIDPDGNIAFMHIGNVAEEVLSDEISVLLGEEE
jgi:peroxiredoxin